MIFQGHDVRDVVDKLTESMKRFRVPVPQEQMLFIACDRQSNEFVVKNFPEARAEML
jgi:hypothetical protein